MHAQIRSIEQKKHYKAYLKLIKLMVVVFIRVAGRLVLGGGRSELSRDGLPERMAVKAEVTSSYQR